MPDAVWIVITPAHAAEMLTRNRNNRGIRRTKVDSYAHDMRAGRWRKNGETIKITKNGDIFDGQHRLHACVLAGRPFETLMVKGLTDADHSTIDTGMKRTLGDELKWRREKYHTVLAAVLRLVVKYDNGQLQDPANPSHAECLAALAREPELRNAVALAYPTRKATLVPQTALATALHLMQREHGHEKTETFANELISGTSYAEGDPCLALRQYATNVANSRMYRPNAVEWLAVLMKAINAWLLSRPVRNLRWRRVGPTREPFPVLVAREDLGEE